MTKHLEREIERLKRKLLAVCARVELNLARAIECVGNKDVAFTTKVVESDVVVDQMEIQLEEECLKILALHQPVAGDLRLVVAALKINNDLERIGDLAVNIAQTGPSVSDKDMKDIPNDITAMFSTVRKMLRMSLKALVNLDGELAREVCAADDQVDAWHKQMFQRVMNAIKQHPERMDRWIRMLSISRYLERIADHTTNIAEDVIYMIDGVIVRHHVKDTVKPRPKQPGKRAH